MKLIEIPQTDDSPRIVQSKNYIVEGIKDGISLRDFIKEITKYHQNNLDYSKRYTTISVSIFLNEEDTERFFDYICKIELPIDKESQCKETYDIFDDVLICCHNACKYFEGPNYKVYLYNQE